jgi:hypothetical protein
MRSMMHFGHDLQPIGPRLVPRVMCICRQPAPPARMRG